MIWSRLDFFARMRSARFGRSKPCTKTSGARPNSLPRMSARVAASAVAVNATVCTPPSAARAAPSARYSGRKSCPHCEMQWASSTASKPDPGAPQQRQRIGLGEPLGRDINQPEPAAGEPLDDPPVLGEIVARVEARGRDPITLELRHLVAHERDQGRHHHGQVVTQQRRQLIAKRLAAAGRHDGEHIGAPHDRLDDGALAGTEVREPEGRAERLLGRHEVDQCGSSGCGPNQPRCWRITSRKTWPYWASFTSPMPCTWAISAGLPGLRRAMSIRLLSANTR